MFSSSNLFWFCWFLIYFYTVFKLHTIFIEFQWICFKFKKIHIKRTNSLKIKIITTTHPFKMILIFIDTLNVTSCQKNIFIFKLALVLLIFNLFLNSIQIKQFFIEFQWICFKMRRIKLIHIMRTKLFLIKIITTTHRFKINYR